LPHGWGVAAPTCDAPDLFEGSPSVDARKPFGVEGHRRRLRERLLTAGPDALADHEMLDPGA
jgi:DNA repair protein RadC